MLREIIPAGDQTELEVAAAVLVCPWQHFLASSDNGALASVRGLIRPESALIMFHYALGLCWCS